ncbi:MAG: indole-3-glycerol phosphate synthase TrpC [Rickettsiales bacterium]
MSDVLFRICADKRRHVAARRAVLSDADIRQKSRNCERALPVSMAGALRAGKEKRGFGVIAEIKKASPSKGVIREDFDPAALARAYREAKVDGVSVLTDVPYFHGSDADLERARREISAPILRKDFMIDVYQAHEAYLLGADCILAILSAIDDALAQALVDEATSLGMETLVEIHDEAEAERACRLRGALLIGVNNRNLATLGVSGATGANLLPLLPRNVVRISESGISSPDDIRRHLECGADAFLIGERFMREPDVAKGTSAFLAEAEAIAKKT